jgi:peptidoglycan/LPS O-acetylase OafA/YrhL
VSRLADASFAIYFVHIPVLLSVVPWVLRQVPAGAAWPAHVGVMLTLGVFALAGSMALVALLQAVFGRRSRWLVGA